MMSEESVILSTGVVVVVGQAAEPAGLTGLHGVQYEGKVVCEAP
jgi:hypothetical protein